MNYLVTAHMLISDQSVEPHRMLALQLRLGPSEMGSHKQLRVSPFGRRTIKGGTEMDIAVLGIDLGKNFCSVVGLDASGAVVVRRSVRRETLVEASSVRRRDGGVLRVSSSGQVVRRPWS
ncbi:hypothetical protein ABIA00_003326 [Bradyrhizobium ottawaense]